MIGLSLATRLRLFFAFAITASPALADTWVIRPEASPPYDAIYTEISDGINSLLKTRSITPSALRNTSWPSTTDFITLGQLSFDALNENPPAGLWLATLLPLPPADTTYPDNVEFIDIRPTVDTVLQRLDQLNAALKTVHIVLDSDQDPQLWERYRVIARDRYNIRLSIETTTDSITTAKAWFRIIKSMDPQTDAVWLTSDKYLESTGTREYILKSSWRKSFFVLSSIPRHALKGVSMAFVPDWHDFGRHIAQIVLSRTDDPPDRTPATDFVHKVVINLRMLSHIGIGLPASMQNDANVLIER